MTDQNPTTGPWGYTIEELCRLCDISPEVAERAIANLLRRGLIEECQEQIAMPETTKRRKRNLWRCKKCGADLSHPCPACERPDCTLSDPETMPRAPDWWGGCQEHRP